MSKPYPKVITLKLDKFSALVLLALLQISFGVMGNCQFITKTELNEFQTNLKWEIKTNQGTSAVGFGIMKNTLAKMSKTVTPFEVMTALETVTEDVKLFEKFIYQCVLAGKGDKNVSGALLYSFCKSYKLANKLFDYVQNKYRDELTNELKRIEEITKKEAIENQTKQRLEDEKEKQRTEEERKRLEEESKIFEKVDVKAAFPGGDAAWEKYIDSVLKIPEFAPPTGIYKVDIQFTVNKDGSINGIKPLTNYGYGLENEAIKVIRKSPKWLPATVDDRHVNSFCKTVITFSIE